MKKLLCILCALLLACSLSACGNNAPPEPPEEQVPAISLDEYNTMVSDFNTRLMEESVLLANAGMYEYNYWKAYSGLSTYGDLDYQGMAEKAMEWLSENAEADTETVEAAHDELIAACIAIDDANVDGEIPEDLPNLVVALFGAYDALHTLVTEPSGEIEDFVLQLKDHTDAITELNENISSLTEAGE